MCNCGCGANGAKSVAAVCERYSGDKRYLVPILHDLQDELGHLSADVMETVAKELGTTAAKVHGVATFYTLFYTKPHGKYVVRICDSPPCHLEGSKSIRQAITDSIGIEPGQTTDDGIFSFEVVSCMGLCGVAPAITVNDDVYGNLKPDAIASILGKYKDGE
jgi:NADH:ubiquinone oxidoreductase subunit E